MSRFRIPFPRRAAFALAALVLWGVPFAAPAENKAAENKPAEAKPGVFVRVALLWPADRPWRVHIVAQMPGGKSKSVFVGKAVADTAKGADFLPAGQPAAWVDLSDAVPAGGATLRFLFETQPAIETPGAGGKGAGRAGVEAKIELATAADESALLRSVTDHDPGSVIAVRVPGEAAKNKGRILSVREDARRRLDEIKAMNLPDGPRPKKLWCMTGFRSNGEFYTDPDIAATDFEIIRRLGMNGYWQQSGGQPGDLRKLAEANGMDRSTVYWRAVETLPRDKDLKAVRLDWDALDAFLDKVYREGVRSTRQQHPGGMPEVVADLMDEPAGFPFDGPEYREAFRDYLRRQGFAPAFFGKGAWEEVAPVVLGWRTYFATRAKLGGAGAGSGTGDENARKLFYWSAKFWNHATARAYALATRKVEQYAPGVGTRVNFGPPWWYDYGTLPRGIDAFEFGRLRSVTLGFNEDWVGSGSPRVPLEINTLLVDWSRAAARPNAPLLGCYVTRDADRAGVKLRTFACLAREAKIFDFYYYGPAYTFFDHWSDNLPMVQGVAELTRDLGSADDVLWEGRAPKAEVALLYSQSWPVWKEDDTEQCEQVMAYLALLHAGLPVDVVSDAEVADGRFAARRYKALYVVNESVPAAAADEIARWVRGGGRLWAGGWAGMRDEYNTPTARWDGMLGAAGRSWKATGDLKRLGDPIEPADWKRPIFAREVALETPEGAPAREPVSGPGPDPAAGQASPAYRVKYGAGRVQVVPWTAGKAYMDGAKEKAGSLAKAVIFPDDARRNAYADFALSAGARPPATTSASQVLAWPLWGQRRGAVLLANYTGEPVTDLRVRVSVPVPAGKVHSLRHGDLPFTRPDAEHVELTLPMGEVTDILTFE